MASDLPKLVLALTSHHGAWVVGSAADPANTSARDIDVLVPLSSWQAASSLIPPNARPNSFGGWKCNCNGVEVDVWPGELGWLMEGRKARWAWQPRTGVRLKKEGE
jgi:hypothetical protein